MNNSKKVNEKWSKKDYQKSSQKVYKRSDKAITLIALIVTIIVLLILAGITINLTIGNNGTLNKAKVATEEYKNTEKNEQADLDRVDNEIAKYMPNGTSGDENEGSEEIPGSTILRKNAPIISVKGLKYADLDGDEIADGIIVADISKDSEDTTTYKGGNPMNSDDSSDSGFSYTTVTSGLKEYSENTSYKYTNADGSTVDGTLIKCTNNTGTPRFYIISLADYDNDLHSWYPLENSEKYEDITLGNFGKGKENTKNMIEAWNEKRFGEHSSLYEDEIDIWAVIQDKVKEGWFIPSTEEWIAFVSYLNIPQSSMDDETGIYSKPYSEYGFTQSDYGTSTMAYAGVPWYMSIMYRSVRYYGGYISYNTRLCAYF